MKSVLTTYIPPRQDFHKKKAGKRVIENINKCEYCVMKSLLGYQPPPCFWLAYEANYE